MALCLDFLSNIMAGSIVTPLKSFIRKEFSSFFVTWFSLGEILRISRSLSKHSQVHKDQNF
jgi:hypothetical protein